MNQVLAIIIFIGMFMMIVWDKVERHIVTLVSGGLMLVLVFGVVMHSGTAIIETLNFQCIFQRSFWYGESSEMTQGINWSTIIFIAGMMIMVESMGKAGFFRWLCLKIAKTVKYRTVPLLICFMCMAGFLSMFIDSITVILFLAAVTAELGHLLKFDPVPLILSEIFCANLGGAATMCGDPPNIIIGTSLGYSFFDFLKNTGSIVALCFVLTVIYFYYCFRKPLKESEKTRGINTSYPQPSEAIINSKAFISSALVFMIVVILLITHAQTTLTVATIGVIAGGLSLVTTIIAAGKKEGMDILKHMDYKTLLFFIGLFIAVGGLEQTGILKLIAEYIGKVSGGDVRIMIVIILWISAISSAFVDNIPFAATMVPVIQSMALTQGVPLEMLAWTLSLGTDIGGNATPIGASANVVGTSVSAKQGHPITWGTYCRYAAPATIMVLIVAMLSIFIRYL